jgi:hypothetical protein
MKLGKLYLIAVLVGTLVVIGCGDDGSSNGGSGGTAGGGGDTGFVCDADVICAECPEGREFDDCAADVFACDTIDPRGCEPCIEDTDPGCP